MVTAARHIVSVTRCRGTTNEMENISYDVEKAEEMLDAAGWKKNADGIREKDGVKAILEFLYPTGGFGCVRRWQPIRRSS